MNIILKVFLTVLVFNFLCFNKVQAREVVTGSGCAISKDYVLTANHVVDNAERIVVSFGNATAMKATVVKKDVVEDWAVLKLDGKAPSYVICSSREVSLGEKIYTLGFPSSRILGEDIKYADGVISSLSGMRGCDNSFQFTVPIQPGNSGGPLFNEDGQVIGIVQSSINPEKFFKATDGALPQNMNFGGRIKTLRSLLGNMIIFDDKKVKMEKNQEATCLIKASIIKQTPNRISNKEMNRSAHNKSESIQKESKHEVSSRYTQLENCLKDIAYDGIFRIPDGDVVDVRTDEGFQKLDDALHLTYDSMCLEVDKNAIVKEKKSST